VLGISLRDVNWIKVYSKEQIEFASPQLTSSILESEICAKLMRAGAMAIELPSIYHPRVAGKPKGGGLRTVIKALKEIYMLYKVTRERISL
jgi:hypothetical protein